jgi:peroxiredoxin
MLKIGDKAPEFTLNDTDGKPVSLKDFRGQNVLVVFYPLAFTPTCTGELKSLTGHAKKYEDLKAKVLGISVDSRYSLGEFKKKEGLGVTLLADFHPHGGVAQEYGVYMDVAGIAKRGTFVVDKDGIIRGITINEPKDARNEEDYFKALATCPI